MFQPMVVNESCCQALVWNRGYGRLQCDGFPWGKLDVCKKHVNLPHGRVRGAIPVAKLNEFKAFALKQDHKKEANQWYSRHLMWRYASELEPDLNSLTELDDEQAGNVFKLKNADYETCLKRIYEYVRAHAKRER